MPITISESFKYSQPWSSACWRDPEKKMVWKSFGIPDLHLLASSDWNCWLGSLHLLTFGDDACFCSWDWLLHDDLQKSELAVCQASWKGSSVMLTSSSAHRNKIHLYTCEHQAFLQPCDIAGDTLPVTSSMLKPTYGEIVQAIILVNIWRVAVFFSTTSLQHTRKARQFMTVQWAWRGINSGV
jgi:hypothetical protein